MRMWMVNPQILCHNHLLGEHVELHMLVGHLNAGKGIVGFVKANAIEPTSICFRHQQLVEEMKRRGYRHKSPLVRINRVGLTTVRAHRDNSVNTIQSLKELLRRCKQCRQRYKSLQKDRK